MTPAPFTSWLVFDGTHQTNCDARKGSTEVDDRSARQLPFPFMENDMRRKFDELIGQNAHIIQHLRNIEQVLETTNRNLVVINEVLKASRR